MKRFRSLWNFLKEPISTSMGYWRGVTVPARFEQRADEFPRRPRCDLAYKLQDDGWQTRMNDALLDYARSHGLMRLHQVVTLPGRGAT